MSWRDACSMASRSIGRRLGRAVLTVLAVTLAAALLSALLIVAGAARTRVLSQLTKGGPLAGIQVAAAAADPGQLDTDNPRPGPERDIDQAALDRIRALPGVRSVVPLISTGVQVVPPDPPVTGSNPDRVAAPDGFTEVMTGFDTRKAHELPITVLAGRLPAPGSQVEVAVTEEYLRRLHLPKTGAKRVIGTELQIGAGRTFSDDSNRRGRWTREQIVGVVAQGNQSGDVIAPIEQVRAAQAWTQSGLFVDFPTSPYSGLFVVADGLSQVGGVRSAITRIGYSTSAPENLIATVQRYLHVVEIVLTGIGLIALVIAALGITNALLAAVRERRREIGVLKAIGARDRDVRRIFLIEASLLGLAGGALGTLAGYLVSQLMATIVNRYLVDQGLTAVHLGVPLTVIIVGVIGSGLLALVAGTVPAQRAARLPARQAMGET
jgi:ABC-type antimicrobial peptide transport system permease subunit